MTKNKVRPHRLTIPLEYSKKIVELAGNGRSYRDCILLTSGEFTDSISRTPIVYTNEALSKLSQNMMDGVYKLDSEKIPLNLDHTHNALNWIGYANHISYKGGKILGDLYLHRLTQPSKDTVALIDNGYLNALSVEITTNDTWNAEENKYYASDINLIGLAVVSVGACPSARIK